MPHPLAFKSRMMRNRSSISRDVRDEVGTGAPQSAALIYLDGVCNEQLVSEARRRMTHIEMDHVSNLEMLEQLLEDSPYSIFPQFAHTERPDRAASFLLEGMAVLLMDGSPQALGVPATLMHMLHFPDVAFLRFQSGTFLRLVSVIGMILTLFLRVQNTEKVFS